MNPWMQRCCQTFAKRGHAFWAATTVSNARFVASTRVHRNYTSQAYPTKPATDPGIDASIVTVQKPRRKKSRRQEVSTLNPDKLTDRDYVDIAGAHGSNAWLSLKNVLAPCRLHFLPHKNRFPPNARGFFYLYHPPGAHVAAWEVRMRLVDRPCAALFPTGRDLTLEHAWQPWRVLVGGMQTKGHRPLYDKLVEEGLLKETELLQLRQAGTLGPMKSVTTVLSPLDRPFVADLSSTRESMWTVEEGRLVAYPIPRPYIRWQDKRRSEFPHLGIGLVRKEAIYRQGQTPQQPLRPYVVNRLLKYLVLPPEDMYRNWQREGELLQRFMSLDGPKAIGVKTPSPFSDFFMKEIQRLYPPEPSRIFPYKPWPPLAPSP